MDSWNVSETTIDCCCERLQLGRCFGSNGEGIAQCDSFINDDVSFCHSFDDPSVTFGCNVRDDCPQTEEDWIPHKPLLDWGLIILFLFPFFICCLACWCILFATCFCGCERPDPEKLRTVNSSYASVIAVGQSFGISVIILACSQLAYETTLYVVMGVQSTAELAKMLGIVVLRGKVSRGDYTKEERIHVEASNVYEDMSNSHCLVITMAICQIGLLGLYIFSLVTEGPPDYSEPITYIYYLFGFFIQVALALKSMTTKDAGFLELGFWAEVLRCTTAETKDLQFELVNKRRKTNLDDTENNPSMDISNTTQPEGSEDSITEESPMDTERRGLLGKFMLTLQKAYGPSDGTGTSSRSSRYLRMFLSVLTNNAGKKTVLFLLPIQLSHSSSAMDFILNSVAAYFILELDDYAESKELSIQNENYVMDADVKPLLLSGGDVEQQENAEDNVEIENDREEGVVGPIIEEQETETNANNDNDVVVQAEDNDIEDPETGGITELETNRKDQAVTQASQDVWVKECD